MSSTDEPGTREQSLALAQRYLQLLRSQDWDAWSRLSAEDASLEFPFAPRGRPRLIHGRESIVAYMRFTTESIAVDGVEAVRLHPMLDPQQVVAELTIRGHLLANGAAYDQTYVTVFELQDGQIRHYREYWNPLVSVEAHGGHEAWLAATARRHGAADSGGS